MLIQIGTVNDVNWLSFEENGKNPNIILADFDQLWRLPVPITLNPSDYKNTSATNDTTNNDQRWIITDKIYKNGYNLCLSAIEFAKRGDWDSFETKIMNNSNIVE